MPIRWLTVSFDFPADAFAAGVGFWREVTGCGLSPLRGAAAEFATLLPPSGDAYLGVQRLFEGDGGCHLDLHVDTASETLEKAADRAEALGARVWHLGAELAIAASPGGFPFCLVSWEGEHAVPGPLRTDGGVSRVDTLCLDVPSARFDRECAFWAELTGWQRRSAPVPGFAYLRRPAGMPVWLLLQRLGAAAPGQQVRGHVDIGCTDEQAVSRHAALGAQVASTFAYWTVLADPAGREYCLVAREPDNGRLPAPPG